MAKRLGEGRLSRKSASPPPLPVAAPATAKPPPPQSKKNRLAPKEQAAPTPHLAFVPAHLDAPATATSRFFERRVSLMTRAIGSPKTPHTVGCGRKPGKQYASHSRRLRFARPAIHLRCQTAEPAVIQNR